MARVDEQLVGAHLRLVEGCTVVDYNVRPNLPGLDGLAELDVLGINIDEDTVFFCEVATHLDGLLYDSVGETVRRIEKKFTAHRRLARERFSRFSRHRFQLWSPRVGPSTLEGLLRVGGFELVANADFTRRVDRLRELARGTTRDIGSNDFFRALQVLEHLKRDP